MNKVLTAIDKSGSFRVYMTISTDMVQKAADIHNTTPLATAALGRVLTGAGLMGLMLKNPQDKLTVIFKGDGPAQQILATADGQGNPLPYGNPERDRQHADDSVTAGSRNPHRANCLPRLRDSARRAPPDSRKPFPAFPRP